MAPLCVQSLHSSVSFSLVYLGVMFLAAFRLNTILSSYWKETSSLTEWFTLRLGVVRSTLLEGLCRSLWSIYTAYCSSWLFTFSTRGAQGTAGKPRSQQCDQPLCKVKSTPLPWGLTRKMAVKNSSGLLIAIILTKLKLVLLELSKVKRCFKILF